MSESTTSPTTASGRMTPQWVADLATGTLGGWIGGYTEHPDEPQRRVTVESYGDGDGPMVVRVEDVDYEPRGRFALAVTVVPLDDDTEIQTVKMNAYTPANADANAAELAFRADARLLGVRAGAFPGSYTATLAGGPGLAGRINQIAAGAGYLHVEPIPSPAEEG